MGEYRGDRPPTPEEARGGSEDRDGDPPVVPDGEIRIDFVRSSGPGGQNVNKTSSKAQLRWNVGASQVFTEEQKAAIRAGAGNRLNNEDEIVMAAQAERSQLQNRGEAVRRLRELVASALAPSKERKPVKVNRSQKQARLDEKRRTSGKKHGRKSPQGDW